MTIEDIKNGILIHEGTPRHSGRYPWGSGENPYQHEGTFYRKYQELKDAGKSNQEMVDFFGMKSTVELKERISYASKYVKIKDSQTAYEMKLGGLNNSEIARRLGYTEGTIRNMVKDGYASRAKFTFGVRDDLKKFVDKYKYVDVGKGSEVFMGLTEHEKKRILTALEKQGYKTVVISQSQNGSSHKTNIEVLVAPDVSQTKSDVGKHKYDIKLYNTTVKIDQDGAMTFSGFDKDHPPTSVDSKRLKVRYAEDGGDQMDGIIELRRGVNDLDLGRNNYSQVRIAVDGTHYLKGVAVYSDDLPPGVDIRFNTSKKKDRPALGPDDDHSVLKLLKKDPNDPFGTATKDDEHLTMMIRTYNDNGVEKNKPINIVNEEGDWDNWSRTLSSQFLSKQPIPLIERQLRITENVKDAQFEEIKALTNPIVKRKMLEMFASKCDSDAVDLKAYKFPGQSNKLIIPVPSLDDNKVYAPTLPEGTWVCLVRHPHGGTFEIPHLQVTHKNPFAEKVITARSQDAIGINAHVAAQLSGADFDGDTVVMIPESDKVRITHKPYLEDLKGFDAKDTYRAYEGMPRVGLKTDGFNKGLQMGVITNLITDMTLAGADEKKIAKATKHSMVIIDAEKHNLDWRRSEQENGIDALKREYQMKDDGRYGGASTLISKSKSMLVLPERKDFGREISTRTVDPETGAKLKVETGKQLYYVKERLPVLDGDGNQVYTERTNKPRFETKRTPIWFDYAKGEWYKSVKDDKHPNRPGKRVYLTEDQYENVGTKGANFETTKMAEADDAHELESVYHYTQEKLYGNYANHMKSLANQARKEYLLTTTSKKDSVAAKKYAKEVGELTQALRECDSNSPLERQAQLLSDKYYKEQVSRNPDMDKEHKKKLRSRCTTMARKRTGASRKEIKITDRQWEAIQNNAVAPSTLERIMNHCDTERLKQLATPRDTVIVSPAKQQQIINLLDSGRATLSDVSDRYNIPLSTVSSIYYSQKEE